LIKITENGSGGLINKGFLTQLTKKQDSGSVPITMQEHVWKF
jgi:hypothetical protein